MIAYFDPCLWSKNKEEAQDTSSEQLYSKTVFSELTLLCKTFP